MFYVVISQKNISTDEMNEPFTIMNEPLVNMASLCVLFKPKHHFPIAHSTCPIAHPDLPITRSMFFKKNRADNFAPVQPQNTKQYAQIIFHKII